MISTPILKNDFKQTYKFIVAITAVLSFINFFLTLVFGKNDPNAASRVISILSMVLYDGGLFMIVGLIFVTVVANMLVSSSVDTGSLSYLLSAPIKRKTFSISQSIYLVCSIFVLCFATTVALIIGFAVRGFDDYYGKIAVLGTGTFALLFACGGIAFAFSCIFDRVKKSYATSGGVFGAFFILTLLVTYGSSSISFFEYFKYVNLFSLYNIDHIVSLSTDLIWEFLVMTAIGGIGITVGNVVFCKKDLHV